MQEFGWSWEYIDEEMTMQRMDAIGKHWEQVPPLAICVAGLLNALTGGKSSKKQVVKQQDPRELFEMLGASGFKQEKPEWLIQTDL
jgi:hypothetical protein